MTFLQRIRIAWDILCGRYQPTTSYEGYQVMIDLTKLTASVARLVAKSEADDATLAAAAAIQPQIDALDDQITAIVPPVLTSPGNGEATA